MHKIPSVPCNYSLTGCDGAERGERSSVLSLGSISFTGFNPNLKVGLKLRMRVSSMDRKQGSMATALLLCALCLVAGLPSALGLAQPENWDWFPGHDPWSPPADGGEPPLFPAPEYPPGGGDGGSPPYDGGSPPGDGGSPPYDGGSPPYDGGSPPYDGGAPPSDGSPPYDGGSPPYDGGSPPYDGGSPPYDGGSPPYDGGSPPSDGGYPPYGAPPYDGGSPPYDGGSPPYDGGSPPYDGGSPPYDGGSPPYDGGSPPYDGGLPPSYPDPLEPPTQSPGDEPIPWFSGCGASYWASTAEKWPADYQESMTIPDVFGKESSSHYDHVSLMDALLTTNTDGYSSLMKNGVAALFNSHKAGYQYSTDEVKSMFNGALSSEDAASVQALKFENANKGYNN